MYLSVLFHNIERVQVRGDDVRVSGLSYDSRTVEPGQLFVALRGSEFDGHRFVEDAAKRGASAVMVQEPTHVGVPQAIVPDTRQALAQVARRFYGNPAAELTTVGITGTNGKTTTTALMQAILEATGLPAGRMGTLGTHFGQQQWASALTTPEASDLVGRLRAMYDAGARAVAMEVSSHALVQHRVDGVGFNVGIFTNFSQDHLDFHGDMESYFAAKAKLVDERLKAGGRAVLNLDNAWCKRLRRSGAIGFSLSGAPDADVALSNLRLEPDGMILDIRYGDTAVRLRSSLLGRFNAENILAAAAGAFALGLDATSVTRGVAKVGAVPGRFEKVSEAGAPLVVVDYAHTPEALAQALATVRELAAGRVILVFGCGGDRDKDKRLGMGEAAARGADYVLVTNDNPRHEDPETIARTVTGGLKKEGMRPAGRADAGGFQVLLDRAEAIREAIARAEPDDVVLIAGKGHESQQIVGDEMRPFDDRSVAREWLQQQVPATAAQAEAPGARGNHRGEGDG